MNMDSILQHFRKDEQPFIENAIGWIREVENLYVPKLTDFLNPRERYIVQTLANNSDLLVSKEGAFSNAERMRMLIYPNYYEPKREDYRVAVFHIHYATKFITLNHKDVLGSLMALGIDRSKFGDIQISDEEVQFAVTGELKDYMHANFTTVGKAKVSISEVTNPSELITSDEMWVESTQVVSSMRLDAVIAALTNFPRQKAVALIKSDKVRVNWATESHTAAELFEEDVLSIRGFGRFKVIAIEGRTKKDKIRLITGKLE